MVDNNVDHSSNMECNIIYRGVETIQKRKKQNKFNKSGGDNIYVYRSFLYTIKSKKELTKKNTSSKVRLLLTRPLVKSK